MKTKSKAETHFFVHRMPTGNIHTTEIAIRRGIDPRKWKVKSIWRRSPSAWDAIEFKRAIAIVEHDVYTLTGEQIQIRA